MTQLKSVFHNDLDDIYDFEEVESFFYLCVEYYLNLSRVDLVMNPHVVISNKTLDVFSIVLKALKQQKPIQYVLGHTQFYGLTFKVNEKVLIPRQETEELVALIISKFTKVNSENKDIKILDIGTGSGCIAVCLARHIPNAKVFALDVSQEALKIAQENAELNQVDITFVETDILDKASWGLYFEDLDFDVIVSNPPYVRQLEKREIRPNVLDYEPHLALFVDDNNPLKYYMSITDFAVNKLKQKGHLYFEINQYLGRETQQLLLDVNFASIALLRDINGNDRILTGVKQ